MQLKHTCHVLLLLGLLFPATTVARFNDIGVGARPLGLGGAFVALADDSNAPNYNAAGLGYIDAIQAGATYAQRFNGLITYNAIGGVIPLGGAGVIGANIGILAEDSEIYREQTLRLAYGNAVLKQIAIGATLKLFSTSFDEANEFVSENPYFTQTSASAVSFDVGVIAKPATGLSLGVSAENLLPANMSISELHTDSVPRHIRAGVAYRLESIAEMSAQGEVVSNLLKSSLVIVEVANRSSEMHVRAGAELWLNKAIAVRGGYGVASNRTGGSGTATTLTLGGSARIPVGSAAFQLDYGFQMLTGDFQDNTTQRASVNLLF